MKQRVLGSCATIAVVAGGLLLGACQPRPAVQSGDVHVDVTDRGFEPAEVRVPAGRAVTLVMTRKTEQTCATEVLFPSLGQRHSLPLNRPVRILLPASPGGTLSYQCGMNMLGGRITFQ
jgi:plastocyanin domain-containing protein